MNVEKVEKMAEDAGHEKEKATAADVEKSTNSHSEDSSSISRVSTVDRTANDTQDKKRDPEAARVDTNDTPPAVKVPRAQRRGLFARFALIAEVEEPKHYSRRVKWFITFVVALAAVAAPMGSAIIFRMRHPWDNACI